MLIFECANFRSENRICHIAIICGRRYSGIKKWYPLTSHNAVSMSGVQKGIFDGPILPTVQLASTIIRYGWPLLHTARRGVEKQSSRAAD